MNQREKIVFYIQKFGSITMERNLTTGSVWKSVLSFSLPYLFSYFLQTLYGMADLFIIGQYEGVASTTAVSVGSQVMHMLTVMLVGLAMGATVSIGHAVGAGDRQRTAADIGNTVTLYGRATSPHMQQFMADRTNDFLRLPESITLTNDLDCVKDAEVIVISVNSQGLQKVFDELAPYHLKNKIFILCMKGIETGTGKRLSEILTESGIASDKIAVWVGPGHIQSFVQGVPNCMVIDSENEKLIISTHQHSHH